MSTPIARRELELKLKVVADAAGGLRALNELGAAAGKLKGVLDSLTDDMGGGAGGKGKGKGGGFFGGDFRTLGMGAATFALVQQSIYKAGELGAAVNDSFATTAQRRRAMFKSLPLGETTLDAVDSITGRKDDFAVAAVENQEYAARDAARRNLEAFELGHNPRQAGLEARSNAFGPYGSSSRAVLEGPGDRSTGAGEQAFRDRQKLLVLEREGQKVARETAAATASQYASEKEMLKLEEQNRALHAGRNLAVSNLKGAGSGATRQILLDYISRQDDAIAANKAERVQAAQGIAAARGSAAQAAYAGGMVNVAGMQTRAGILEEQAGRAGGLAQRLGGMDRFARADAVQSLEYLQKYGPDVLSQEQIAQAQSIAPQTVAKILEARGARTGEFARARELAPAEIAGDPESLRAAAGALRDRAAEFTRDLESQLSATMTAAGRDLADVITGVMKGAIEAAAAKVVTDMLRGKGPAS